MKAVFVTPYFFPKVGGLENYALQISKGLIDKYGWEITIITSNHEDNSYIEETIGSLKIIRLKPWVRLSNTPINPLWYWQIKSILKKLKPDVVNAHTPVPFISDIAVIAAKNLKIPAILTYQNDLVKDSSFLQLIISIYYKLLGQRTLDLAKKIVVTSRHYAEQSPILKTHLNKIVIIPPGIFSTAIKSQKDLPFPFILFVGQLDTTHRHKGLSYLLKSLTLIRKNYSNLQLVVIGKGNDVEKYKDEALRLGINGAVNFLGYITDEEMNEYYASAVCLCLPSTSYAEGFGMVILEAAARMTPSVASKIGGIPSVIIDGETGILVPPRDINKLATAIEKLLAETALNNEMGKNAYKRVIKDFTWEKQVDKSHQLFQSEV